MPFSEMFTTIIFKNCKIQSLQAQWAQTGFMEVQFQMVPLHTLDVFSSEMAWIPSQKMNQFVIIVPIYFA